MLAQSPEKEWGGLLVRKPAKSTENEELPLIAAHSNILNGQVDHFSLSYKTLDLIFDFLMTGPAIYDTLHRLIKRIGHVASGSERAT